MISLLRGKIAEKSLGRITIDVNGVGYGVAVPLSTYYKLSEIGSETELKIYTHMKDSLIDLYGFLSDGERSIFTMLLGVSGVGPRVAVNILSNVSPGDLVKYITSGELKSKKIPGLGPKLATRLITELKDKISKLSESDEIEKPASNLEDIISALLNLGYRRNEIDEHISGIEEIVINDKDIQDSLKEVLKIMRKA